MANVFKYTVYCGDYSLAGYSEDMTYSGTDRKEALKAYREAKSWLGMARVKINVLGRETHIQNRNNMINSGFANEEFGEDELPF